MSPKHKGGVDPDRWTCPECGETFVKNAFVKALSDHKVEFVALSCFPCPSCNAQLDPVALADGEFDYGKKPTSGKSGKPFSSANGDFRLRYPADWSSPVMYGNGVQSDAHFSAASPDGRAMVEIYQLKGPLSDADFHTICTQQASRPGIRCLSTRSFDRGPDKSYHVAVAYKEGTSLGKPMEFRVDYYKVELPDAALTVNFKVTMDSFKKYEESFEDIVRAIK